MKECLGVRRGSFEGVEGSFLWKAMGIEEEEEGNIMNIKKGYGTRDGRDPNHNTSCIAQSQSNTC